MVLSPCSSAKLHGDSINDLNTCMAVDYAFGLGGQLQTVWVSIGAALTVSNIGLCRTANYLSGAAMTEEIKMKKPVQLEELMKEFYASDEGKKFCAELEQFYRAIGLGHFYDDPSTQPPMPEGKVWWIDATVRGINARWRAREIDSERL